MLYSWLHLVALVVYLGAILGFWFMLLPAVNAAPSHDGKLQLLARLLKFYNPLQTGALGIILFSGAFQLTDFKAEYRETFTQQFAYNLAVKLALTFVLVIFSVYQALGIGHRFVRRHEGGEAFSADQLTTILRRMSSANGCILVLAALTLWLGLRLRY